MRSRLPGGVASDAIRQAGAVANEIARHMVVAPHRDGGQAQFVPVTDRLVDRGAREARAQGVHGDVIRRQRGAEGPGQADDGVPGRGADRVVGDRGQPGQAGGEDHGAVEVDGHQGSRSPAVTGGRCTRSSPRSRASTTMTARRMPGARSAITSE